VEIVIFTSGYSRTASGNIISTGGFIKKTASGKVSRLFLNIYLHTQTYIYIYIDIDKHVVLVLKATWN
jgi:hypothetical protein